VGKTKRGKGSKIMAIADRRGLPVAVHVESVCRSAQRVTWMNKDTALHAVSVTGSSTSY